MLAKMVSSRNILRERPVVATVVHRCGGLPLALRALGERLAVNRHWPVAKLAARIADHDGLLAELKAAGVNLDGCFQADLAELDASDRYALARLCESGLDCFTAKNAVSMIDVSEREAEDSLDRLVAANMLRVSPLPDAPEFNYALQPLLKDCITSLQPKKSLHVVPALAEPERVAVHS